MTNADQLLHNACREVIAAYRIAHRCGRHIPASFIETSLRMAADDAATILPDTPAHLGATWENKW